MIRLMKTALAVLAVSVAAASNAQDVRVQIDGKAIIFSDAQPQKINGRVLVPMRRIFEQLGAQVNWDRQTRTVRAEKEGNDIELRIGDRRAMVKGNPVTLDVPAMVVNGSTMVPIRFVSEAMGAQVGWMEAQRLVIIDTGTAVVAQQPQRLHGVLIPATSVIHVTLDRHLDSQSAQRGDQFTATLSTSDLPEGVSLPNGTKIEGHVAAIRPYAEGHRAMIDLAIDRIQLPSGRTIPFDAKVIRIESQDLSIGRDGMFVSGRSFRVPSGTIMDIRARHSVERG